MVSWSCLDYQGCWQSLLLCVSGIWIDGLTPILIFMGQWRLASLPKSICWDMVPEEPSAPMVYSPEISKEAVYSQSTCLPYGHHTPHFHGQFLSFLRCRAVLGGLVLLTESMPAIHGIRDQHGQQFSRLLPSGHRISFSEITSQAGVAGKGVKDSQQDCAQTHQESSLWD